MNRYDLIAFDMDGTLLDSNHQITQDSLDAIDAAVNAGKTVILSTGRSLSELKDYRQMLKHVRYFILRKRSTFGRYEHRSDHSLRTD